MFTFLHKIRLRLLGRATSDTVRKLLIDSGPSSAAKATAGTSARKPVLSRVERYLLYAIGEIALVVFGILIASRIMIIAIQLIKSMAYNLLRIGLFYLIIVDSYGQVEVLGNLEMDITVNGYAYSIPYFSSHSLESSHPEITRLVLVVHGTNRNAIDYFENMKLALSQRPELVSSTAIIAPQFLIEEDITSFSLGEEYPYWSINGWASGSNSRSEETHPRSTRIPSFEILDTLLMRVATVFSDLEYVIFTGHSAGGRLANRYAASSPIFDILCENGISNKSIVANANTFVYLSDERRVGDSEDQFESFTESCDGFNDWSFGLEDLFEYPSRFGKVKVMEAYSRREVVYLIGDQDNDPNAISFSCQGMAQGTNRFQRGKIYYNHIIDHYGISIQERHRLSIVPGVGHDHAKMYQSEEGIKALFDDTPISQCNSITSTFELSPSMLKFYPNPAAQVLKLISDKRIAQSSIISIVNHTGQKVWSRPLQKEMTIDISAIISGLYFLEVVNGKTRQVDKLVIMR